MAEDLIRYDVLAQEALRGLVRKVLAEVAQTGLPGEHHFFVTFDTRHPGVRISPRLKAEYPGEMTVVLQHQFWDLTVTDSAFEVGLSFKGVPEQLLVPFRAINELRRPACELRAEIRHCRRSRRLRRSRDRGGCRRCRAARARRRRSQRRRRPDGAAAVVSLDAFRKKNG